jgi:hypothetical protein
VLCSYRHIYLHVFRRYWISKSIGTQSALTNFLAGPFLIENIWKCQYLRHMNDVFIHLVFPTVTYELLSSALIHYFFYLSTFTGTIIQRFHGLGLPNGLELPEFQKRQCPKISNSSWAQSTRGTQKQRTCFQSGRIGCFMFTTFLIFNHQKAMLGLQSSLVPSFQVPFPSTPSDNCNMDQIPCKDILAPALDQIMDDEPAKCWQCIR